MARFTSLAVALVTGSFFFAIGGDVWAQEAGDYHIRNLNSTKLLTVDGAGGKITQDVAKKSLTQDWTLVKVGAAFKIVNSKTGRAITAPKSATEDNIIQADLEKDTGAKNQLWLFEKHEKKGATFFSIKSVSSGLVLDARDGNKDAGVQIILYPYNAQGQRMNQFWVLLGTK